MGKAESAPDRRKIFISAKFNKPTCLPLAEADWLTLQTKLKQPLPLSTRKQLTNITKKYASFARDKNSQQPLKKILSELSALRKRTNHLRNIVWLKEPHFKNTKKKWANFDNLIDKFFNVAPSELELTYPLARLDRFLAGGIAILDHAEGIITAKERSSTRETELWFLWATIVIAILKQANIPVKNLKRKEILPGPILVIEKLQATLPQHLQRRKGASLRKAAVHAYKMSRSNPTATMRRIFDRWGAGDVSFGTQLRFPADLGLSFFLARFNKHFVAATKREAIIEENF